MVWSSTTPKSRRRIKSQCRLQDEFSARVTVFCSLTLLFLITLLSALSRAQPPLPAKPSGAEPVPQPALTAILRAFDTDYHCRIQNSTEIRQVIGTPKEPDW
jgi:hypothetical protein